MVAAVSAGLMVPSTNTTFQAEVLSWLPHGSACTVAHIPRGKGLLTRETLPAYTDSALGLAAQFAGDEVDVVIYGCTAAGFISGPTGDAKLTRDLGRVTCKPVVTVARSMVLALQREQARKIALVTPYQDEVNAQLVAFLAHSGISVRRFASFYAANVEELGRIEAPQVAAIARETMDENCDALFIACSQLPTLPILHQLKGEFGKPVISAISASTAEAIRAVVP
jgi:maleate cis-trans isomerase